MESLINERSAAPLLLGTAKVDITPAHPLHLGGYGSRTTVFERVDHPLYARIMYFQQKVGDTVHQKLIIAGDIIWWGVDFTAYLRTKLNTKWGFLDDEIMLSASHTHSGPQIDERISLIGAVDEQYVQALERTVLEGIEQAMHNVEPVTISRGTGQCHFGVYRRQQVNGKITMLPNPDGPNDQEVTVIKFANEDDVIKSLIVHFTCHTTTTADNAVSSDYSGVAMNMVEEVLGPNIVSSFVQGCCGDVRPHLVKDGRFYNGHDEEVRELAGQLSREVMRILSEPMQTLGPARLASQRVECPLVYTHVPTREELEKLAGSDHVWIQRWAKHMLAHPDWLTTSIPLDLVRIDIADGLSLLSMNAEVVVKYGIYIKQRSDNRVLPLAYTNGVIGYVPTAEQIAEGGYEAGDSHIYFGLCAPFVPQIEQAITASIDQLLKPVM